MENYSLSELSEGSKLLERVALYRELFSMDDTSGMLLCRAEHLHEKGKPREALKYYQRVIKICPSCSYAVESSKLVAELLKEAAPNRLSAVPENVRNSGHYTITDMDVIWKDYSDPGYDDAQVDEDENAFKDAKKLLRKIGVGNSLLALLKNDVTCENFENVEIHWHGKARFRVTLIPDREEEDHPTELPSLDILQNRRDQQKREDPKDSGKEAEIAASAASPVGKTVQVPKDATLDLSSSRFADAETHWSPSTTL